MSRFTKDLAVLGFLFAGIAVSLVVVSFAAAPTISTTPESIEPDPAAIVEFVPDPPTAPTASPSLSTAPVATRPPTAAPAPTVGPPAGEVMVLSSGLPVLPRPDLTQGTPRSPLPPPSNAPATAPVDQADSVIFQDPTLLAVQWLNALCWYDFHAHRDDNLRRAAHYGSTQLPAGQDPFSLTEQAWAAVTAQHLSSACTGITAIVEPSPLPAAPVGMTVRVTGTQILSAAGRPFQAATVTLVRSITRNPDDGRWSIGPPVTAN